ncbi:unnamed protein product [Angiostrongylus costaricensis]|uniref:Aromatic-L-amino-acid decarboxylase n=1 Tax=Angiostrongylus costaricensis TaxID=334426 RepID=A0A158PGU6_ANGCS|nr:unnamed protein product [Angiostrongylus costaricensis]
MNSDEFRKYGKEMVDYVADFWDHIRERRPLPNIKPGYIKDVVNYFLKGNTYWHHPHFFAYFPTACSYPAIIADILSGGIAGIGFSWNSHPGNGCGIIQCTASDATMIAIMSARARAVEEIKNGSWTVGDKGLDKTSEAEQADPDMLYPHFHDPAVFQKFVAYCSDQVHYYGGLINRTSISYSIHEDRARGLIPFTLIATMGTTSSCGMDRLDELAPICNREHIWLHVDAAYAGSFLTCPEFRYMSKGVELVDSFNFNSHKSMLVNFDCSPMWFKDGVTITKYFNVDATYLKHEYQAAAADYRQNEQAMLFAKLVTESDDFELFVPQHLGLVCFRIKGSANEENEALCAAINDDRRIHLVPSKVHDKFFLRFVVCSQLSTDDDIRFAFDVCKEVLVKIRNGV